jgi:hypothetical protein
LKALQKRLLPRCRPILVTDAGFRTPWFKQAEALGWDWVGRIRTRHEVQLPGEEEWIPSKSSYPQATSTPKALGRARYKSLIFTSVRLPYLSSLLTRLGLADPWRWVPGKAAYSMCWDLI